MASLLLISSLVAAPMAGAQTGSAAGNSELSGRVIGPDGVPARGVVVIAYHLSSEAVFRSEPTDIKGQYAIAGLPYGYFDVAVEDDKGLYPTDQVINVPPAGKAVMTLTLATGAASAEPRQFPGAEGPTVGSASVAEKLTGRDFWKSPKGVGILVGVGGAVLLAIASGGGSSRGSTSPSTP